jgi:hypothetical protein
MKVPLHPACAIWPEMDPKDLRDLADDIAANGLRDAITVTPAGELLDGRNRALACEMAGVEIPNDKVLTYGGDPWLYSISRNARRRHMPIDAIAMVVAAMPMKEIGANQFGEGASFEAPSVAEAAEAAGIPKTALQSAKVVHAHGADEEKAEARQKGKLRKVAETIRGRMRAAPAKKKPEPPVDPIQALASEIEKSCNDGEWRIVDKTARFLGCAASALKGALTSLEDVVEWIENGEKFRLCDRSGLAAPKDGAVAAGHGD